MHRHSSEWLRDKTVGLLAFSLFLAVLEWKLVFLPRGSKSKSLVTPDFHLSPSCTRAPEPFPCDKGHCLFRNCGRHCGLTTQLIFTALILPQVEIGRYSYSLLPYSQSSHVTQV